MGRLPSPETVLAIAAVVAAALGARLGWRWLGWWERPIARLARRKTLAILFSAALPMLLRVILLPWFPIPEPRIHDEFTILLGADTLAHGRLANPQHPMWPSFETEHVLSRPTYASAFPMGQAAALAIGEVALGIPWVGVWLTSGFMCGAICWMLQGWLPPRWALLGAVLIALRLGVSSYWMNSYWGGCLAAAGGALVLGALPRIVKNPNWRPAVAMGLGLAILANTRTFEGAVLGLIVAVPLLAWMWKRPAGVAQVVLPLALVLGAMAVGMGYSFARVTGKPWLAPYVLYRNTMTVAPHFLWQSPGPEPLYDNQDLRSFYVHWEIPSYHLARNPGDLWTKLNGYWRFYLGPLLSIPLLTIPWMWRTAKTRRLLLMGAAFVVFALMGQVWHNFHYAAPATGLAILLVVEGMRRLQLWYRPIGRYLVRCLPLACAVMLVVQIAAGPAPVKETPQAGWRWPALDGLRRARILHQLERSGGKHLIIVRYNPWHNVGDEWVYNGANIDGSPVVWARELDRASNQKLIQYFNDRQVWLVEPDLASPVLTPYQDDGLHPMRFVPLGAPGIEAVRSVDEVRRKVLEKVGADAGRRFSCDVWNYYFTAVTGVLGANVENGCYHGDRGEAVSFEQWFTWLQGQR